MLCFCSVLYSQRTIAYFQAKVKSYFSYLLRTALAGLTCFTCPPQPLLYSLPRTHYFMLINHSLSDSN